MSRFKSAGSVFLLTGLLVLMQNCSEVSFSPTPVEEPSFGTAANVGENGEPQQVDNESPIDPIGGTPIIDPETVICNPLSGEICDGGLSGAGLIGNLYYLVESDIDFSLRDTVLDDYPTYGTRMDELVLFSDINVSPRSWLSGFNSAGHLLKDSNDNILLEWFHIDLAGFISPPAGEYQFAIVSDDGMQVIIDDEMILNDDGLHSPRTKCSQAVIVFDGSPKPIRVRYFQGPQTEVAMQLFIRDASSGTTCTSNLGNSWVPVPAEYFTH